MIDNLIHLWQKISASIFSIIIVSLLILAAAGWGIYNATQVYLNLNTPLPASKERISTAPKQNLMEGLHAIHVLGESALSNLPSADFGMKLQGIFLNPPPQNSRILIAMVGQPAQSYAVNDVLPNGARVYQILPDSVVLVQNGKLVKLSFPAMGIDFPTTANNSGLF